MEIMLQAMLVISSKPANHKSQQNSAGAHRAPRALRAGLHRAGCDMFRPDHIREQENKTVGRRSADGDMPGALILGVVLAAALTAASVSAVAAQTPVQTQGNDLCDTGNTEQFSDVASDDYAAAHILCAKALGLAKGTKEGTFNGAARLTRAQMASFLVRLWRDVLGKPCPATPAHAFTDIAGNTHEDNIACLYALGITTGKTATSYAPTSDLTTTQITLFTSRTLTKAKPGACDGITQTGSELQQAAACLTALGIAPSVSEATTKNPATRARMALYLIGAWRHAATPAQPTPTSGFIAITAGSRHSCGVKADNTAICWGDNDYGQTTVPTGRFNTVAATFGSAHTCGIKTDNTAICWGNDDYGQATAPADEFIAVTAGGAHSCGIKTDGTAICWGNDAFERTTVPTAEFNVVTAGLLHSCGIKTDGTAICWGYDNEGQATAPADRFTAITAGWLHSCGIKTDGTAICWGYNGEGQAAAPSGRFTAITAAATHSCGIKTDGTAICWGEDADGKTTAPAGEFTAITVGMYHSCGIKTSGTAICWGRNDNGQADVPVS